MGTSIEHGDVFTVIDIFCQPMGMLSMLVLVAASYIFYCL